MSDTIAHDNVTGLHGDVVDEQLAVAFVDSHRDTQQSLVLLSIFEGSGIPNVTDDTVVLQSIDDLVSRECCEVDACPLEGLVGWSKAGEFSGGIDDFGEVGGLDGLKKG